MQECGAIQLYKRAVSAKLGKDETAKSGLNIVATNGSTVPTSVPVSVVSWKAKVDNLNFQARMYKKTAHLTISGMEWGDEWELCDVFGKEVINAAFGVGISQHDMDIVASCVDVYSKYRVTEDGMLSIRQANFWSYTEAPHHDFKKPSWTLKTEYFGKTCTVVFNGANGIALLYGCKKKQDAEVLWEILETMILELPVEMYTVDMPYEKKTESTRKRKRSTEIS